MNCVLADALEFVMKILFVTMALGIGGAETHVVELSRALAAMGHDVTVASAGGVFVPALEAAGVRHVTLPLDSKRPGAVLAAKSGLTSLILGGGFDVVHGHARIPNFILSRVHKKAPFRFAATAHGTFAVNALWRKLSFWGERTIAVADDVRDYLVREYGVSPDKIDVTVNGIDTSRFAPRDADDALLSEFGLDPSHRRVVFVGRLEADNDLAARQLCEIAPSLSADFGDLDIVIVGDGGDAQNVRAAADRANEAAGRTVVTLAGARSDVERVLCGATAFVGIARCALEAMACGVPAVVAGSYGYIGVFDAKKLEIARGSNFCGRDHGPATDVERDVRAVLEMSEDERRALGEYGRTVVAEHYSVDKMARDYLDCWAKMGL